MSGTQSTTPMNGRTRTLASWRRARSVGAVVALGIVAVFYRVQGEYFWRQGQATIQAAGVRGVLLVVALVADIVTVALLLGVMALTWHRPATAKAWGWYAVLASAATSGLAFFLPGGLVMLGVLAGVLLGPALSNLAQDREPAADGKR